MAQLFNRLLLPDGTNVFELLIVLLEGGAGTTYIFNDIKIGSEFVFRGAVGVFTLPEQLDKDLFLICTGTGIAPFRSMLHHIELHNVPHGNIYLLFGCRQKCNLLYYDEMRELAEHIPRFHYIPTLSREEWEGKKGMCMHYMKTLSNTGHQRVFSVRLEKYDR